MSISLLLQAAERFEELSLRQKSSADDFDQAREGAQSATVAFNEVKQKRHDAFMACFNHISEELQSIYKDLTKSSKHPLGGNAYLSLDDCEVMLNLLQSVRTLQSNLRVSGTVPRWYKIQRDAAHETVP